MKKILFTLAIIAVLALTSCGNKKAPAGEVPVADTTAVIELVDTVAVQ